MNKVVSSPVRQRTTGWIITEVAKRMGADWSYKKPKDIFAEIRKVTPSSYAGITYDRIKKELLQWPCLPRIIPGPSSRREKFSRGLGV